jgi:hypothetical protein
MSTTETEAMDEVRRREAQIDATARGNAERAVARLTPEQIDRRVAAHADDLAEMAAGPHGREAVEYAMRSDPLRERVLARLFPAE